jgi:predicted amidohydrolase YtcJ
LKFAPKTEIYVGINFSGSEKVKPHLRQIMRKSQETVTDSVYLNGNIYTVDDKNPKATAMSIKDGTFLCVGTDPDARTHVGRRTSVFDLQGKTVLPGLIDAHLHYSAIGEARMRLDVFWKPKQEILDAVAAICKKATTGEWIQGRGWNQEVWTPAVFPTKEDLDKVAPDNPICLIRTDSHAAWVNSKALDIAGITGNVPNPAGGEIFRDAKGEATGILIDTARGLVSKHIPPISKEQMLDALLLAQEEMVSNGLTGGHDAGCDLTMIEVLKVLYESDKLYVRLYERLRIPEGNTSHHDDFYAKGKQIGFYHDRLTVRGIKMAVDGALGSRGALMLQPYSDRPDGYLGNQRVTEEELYDQVKRARLAGFQVSVHAIGDAANRRVLNAYERVLKEMPNPDHRYRIEHAQVVTLEDIPRFAALGVIPSMQTIHAISDKNMAEKRVGPVRIKGTHAWRKFLNTGVVIPNGTDAPVERVNPFYGISAAVTRQDRNGQPPGGWYPEEKMTREEALKSYTIWAAYAAFEEKIKGSIETGKLADFVVIDRDYMNCGESEVKDIRVLETVIGGRSVYPVSRISE